MVVIGVLYSLLEGMREAYMYNMTLVERNTEFNEHIIFTAQRLLVFTLMYFNSDLWTVIALVFAFPFIHDGMYYTVRNYLNPKIYKNRWFAESKTSTAVFEFSVEVRILLFIIGIGIYSIFG